MGAPTRVTKGHRAAVCGLILAGVPFRKACLIVAAPRDRLREHLGGDWTRSPMEVPVREMTRKQFAIYRKLVPILGRNQAVEQALAP